MVAVILVESRMEHFLILVMLAGGLHAFTPVTETKCSLFLITPCSAVLGGTVYIQVMTNASGYQLRCKKMLPSGGSVSVFGVKREKVTIHEEFKNRAEFFINNGTLKITNVVRNDSSQYSVEVFEPNGILVNMTSFSLNIQENTFHIVIPTAAALGAFVLLVCCCCGVCIAVKRRKKSDSRI